jgi:hypothetical protein
VSVPLRLVLAISACCVAAPTEAQTANHLAIGAEVVQLTPQDRASHGGIGVGFNWRFGHSGTGWGWSCGFGWYSTDIERGVGSRPVEIGELKVRPFVVGYGYTRSLGRTSLSATLLGGYAFTSFRLSPFAAAAYAIDNGDLRPVTGDVSNTFVLRPEIGLWYDLNRKMGLHVALAYVVARPKITVQSSRGEDSWRYRADSLALKVGAVYSVF